MRDPLASEFRDAQIAKMTAAWSAADANQDGLLNLDEWRVWYEGVRKTRGEEGYYVHSG